MDEKKFLEEVGAARNSDPKMVDGEFHVLDRERIATMRALIHKNIDSIFDGLVFDEKGWCITPISIETKRDYMPLAAGGGKVAHIPTSFTYTIKTEETLSQLSEHIAKAQAR